jgi:subtilisin-like proprotein convertase family protein
LKPPATTGGSQVTLHNRSGSSTRDLKKTYDASTTSALGGFAGKSCKGIWTLLIQDAAAVDTGKLLSFGLILSFPHVDRVVREPKPRRGGKKKK